MNKNQFKLWAAIIVAIIVVIFCWKAIAFVILSFIVWKIIWVLPVIGGGWYGYKKWKK